ncbi:copper-transporting ATPase 1, partial [Magnaporthiopsis poae ATCC 64411]
MAPSHTAASRSTDPAVTSFLLGNLHCPTCVSAIKSVLHASCRGQIKWVSPNIVTAVVTVEHDPDAPIATMAAELEQAGFRVCGVTSTVGEYEVPGTHATTMAAGSPGTGGDGASDSARDKGKQPALSSSGWLRSPVFGSRSPPDRQDAHLRNCEECRRKSTSSAKGPESPGDTAIDSIVASPRPAVKFQTANKHQGLSPSPKHPVGMSTKSFVTTDVEDAPIWRATLAIGGMTCAACSNTITKDLERRDWVSNITVNLLTNSATIDFLDKDKTDQIVEAIESLGYDAAVDSVVAIQENSEDGARQERTVEIAVEGMYCEHCPGRVTRSLAPFASIHSLIIDKEPTRQHPILRVTYVPRPPGLTVRKIIAAIEASDPAFSASIHHPPTLEERSKEIQRRHQRQILYRVIFTGIVCVPTFVLGIVYMSLIPEGNGDKHHLMLPWTSGISRLQMALFIMATPVYFFAADIFHVRAFKEVWALWRRGSRTPVLQRFYRFGSMNTLMSLGTTIAYVSSTSQLIAAAVYQPKMINDSNFYFDAVVFLTFFLLLGRLIESYSKSKTGSAVEALGKLRPATAILVEPQQSSTAATSATNTGGRGDEKGDAAPAVVITDTVVKTDLLDLGDIVRIPHGSSPPADGVVVQGTSSFDESSLTGESRPIRKSPGDAVYAGTVNNDGPVLARVTGASGHSMLDQIVRVVREGQARRAPLEQFADLLTTYFVPCVTLIAILTWIVWLALGLTGSIGGHFLDVTSGGWVAFSLQFAISVFVVACPCGIALAAPTAIFVGGGLAARHGILAKGGGLAFETASRTSCVVFDKTGTLTMGGEPKITDSEFFLAENDEQEKMKQVLLAALKAIEENSSHTVAKALVSFCAEQAPPSGGTIEEVQEIPGKGMKGTYVPDDGSPAFEIIVGNMALMEQFSAPAPAGLAKTITAWTEGAKSVALVASRPQSPVVAEDDEKGSDNTTPFSIGAAFAMSDPIRPEARAVVAALRQRGLQVYMLSGDNAATARAVGARLGIEADNVLAEVLPTQKAEQIKRLQIVAANASSPSKQQRAIVAMVGDGVNDAPALAQADVGVAVGSGSDVAISSAGFVLVQSDLRNVVTLLELSAAVFRRIKLNFGWALVYNVLAVPVA